MKRGGFCYELNSAFYWLLVECGYKVKMISASVVGGTEKKLREYDHLALVVSIEKIKYLVDVGFGDFIIEPLLLKKDIEQKDKENIFRIVNHDKKQLAVQKKINAKKWKDIYLFTTKARKLNEFNAMCHFHQTSAESHFTKNKICSQLTKNGRITLSNKKFIVTENGRKKVKTVEKDLFSIYLKKFFNLISLS